MSTHVFGAIVTHHGIAANNRGETEGNVTTLQKILWHGQVHTTVSAEAIRFALRRLLAEAEDTGTNRVWDEDRRANTWKEDDFDPDRFIDDDLLGYMRAEAAKEEGQSGSANVRRAVLEVARAISLTPWAGDVTFNAASIGATPSAARRGENPVLYGTELHATRYQYGFAMTPLRLKKPARAAVAIERLSALGTVAGNHGRFLFDFSPESIIFRITEDPAPRLLYVFESREGDAVDAPRLLARVQAGDIHPQELIIGGGLGSTQSAAELKKLGAAVEPGVRKAAELAIAKLGA